MLSIAFRNGMTLENRPKNEGMRTKFLFWCYFYQNLKKSKTPGWGPLGPFLGHRNGMTLKNRPENEAVRANFQFW